MNDNHKTIVEALREVCDQIRDACIDLTIPFIKLMQGMIELTAPIAEAITEAFTSDQGKSIDPIYQTIFDVSDTEELTADKMMSMLGLTPEDYERMAKNMENLSRAIRDSGFNIDDLKILGDKTREEIVGDTDDV